MFGFHDPLMSFYEEPKTPFDAGFQSGVHQGTLFDCPYGHVTNGELRLRHEWLEGYMTALSEMGLSSPL